MIDIEENYKDEYDEKINDDENLTNKSDKTKSDKSDKTKSDLKKEERKNKIFKALDHSDIKDDISVLSSDSEGEINFIKPITKSNIVKEDDEKIKKKKIDKNTKNKNKIEEVNVKNNEGKELTEEDLNDIQQLVNLWYLKDKEYNTAAKQAKEINDEKKQVEQLIIEIMDVTEKNEVAGDNGTVIKDISLTKRKVNDDDIIKILSKVCSDEKKILKLTEELFEELDEKENVKLKKKKDAKNKKEIKKNNKIIKM